MERFWVEANSRVNYPVKAALNDMCNAGMLDIDNEIIKYCVSWYAMNVIKVGLQYAIGAWNCHPIPGKKYLLVNISSIFWNHNTDI